MNVSSTDKQHFTGNWRPIFVVFLPFSASYYLSYLLRTINALISNELRSDLSLGAANLGLLTAVYFLAFAAAQLPIGILLDRYGPRRVQSALLGIAALGAALFGMGHGLALLVVARALIGLGVAAALTAGFKALALWFPKERLTVTNGCMMMIGALGAVTATAPAEVLLNWLGWRGLFELLALVSAGCALATFLIVPEGRFTASMQNVSWCANLRVVYAEPRFRRLAPLSASCVGTALGLQGLWAAPWLTDVEGLDKPAVVRHLFCMALGLSFGALLLGIGAQRLRDRGIRPHDAVALLSSLFIAVQLVIILRLPLPSYLCWTLAAIVGAAPVLSYASLAEYFPKELIGRANGALGMCDIGMAFILQYTTGLIIGQWTPQAGHYLLQAYQWAFAVNVAIQAAALLWFLLPQARGLASKWAVKLLGLEDLLIDAFTGAAPYVCARRVWAGWLRIAREQASSWRTAGLGLAGVVVLLGSGNLIAASRGGAVAYMVAVDGLNGTRSANGSLVPEKPSDPQIAFLLSRLVRNIRSLSTDPIVVRSNWLEAYNYVTAKGARMLNEYARASNPFADIGVRPVSVDIIYVVRSSPESFEIRWKESTYESRSRVRTEHFTGVAKVVPQSFVGADALRNNPLGLYVDTIAWVRDRASDDLD